MHIRQWGRSMLLMKAVHLQERMRFVYSACETIIYIMNVQFLEHEAGTRMYCRAILYCCKTNPSKSTAHISFLTFESSIYAGSFMEPTMSGLAPNTVSFL